MSDHRPFVPSPYQQRVFEWARAGSGSAILKAVAGSGKTTTIINMLPHVPGNPRMTLLAFNNGAGKALTEKLEELRGDEVRNPRRMTFANVQAKTFHSLGYGAVLRALEAKGFAGAKPDDKKLMTLCRNQMNAQEMDIYASFCCKLVSFARGVGIGVLKADTFENWWELTRHHDLFLEHEEADEGEAISHAMNLLHQSNAAADGGLIDFDDMLYLPLLWRLRLFQVDWVVVDEAQDTNPVRRALVKAILRPGGRSLWVGDPKQSIYGFTGASVDAMDVIAREFNCVELPLTVSYRCCRAVGDKAREIVDYFETHEAAPPGAVEEMSFEQAVAVLDRHDAILCRNTAPLIETAYRLISQGIGCTVLGREIGQGLISLIDKMHTRHLDVLEKKLELWRDRQVERFMAKGEEQKAEGINDKVACILTIIEHSGADDVAGLRTRIMSMFSDSNGVLTLATQHKAKGREWRRVAILEPRLNPSKWARQDWQYQQERHLMYVAWTRAMEHLIFIGSAKQETLDGDDHHSLRPEADPAPAI